MNQQETAYSAIAEALYETAVPTIFDDLEELLEESKQEEAAAADTLDLDDLLAESTAIAGAKRAKATGRKLTEEQKAILEANALASEQALWHEALAVAHWEEVRCTCGHADTHFRGWLVYLRHARQAGSSKLVRVAPQAETPRKQFRTAKAIAACSHCAPRDLEVIEIRDLPLLAEIAKGGV